MTVRPDWPRRLLAWLAPDGQAEDVLGDLEEGYRGRVRRHGRMAARLLTALEALEMAAALVRARVAVYRTNRGNIIVQDYKLGLRMLVKYPGLTIAGGLALAIAIGMGAGWFDVSRDLWRPTLPLPGGDRIVDVEMRTGGEDERRLAHDFFAWREQVRSLEDLGAYRTIERSLVVGDAAATRAVTAATSAYACACVAPGATRPNTRIDGPSSGAYPDGRSCSGIHNRWFTGNAKPSGMTPTTVVFVRASSMVRPMTSVRPPKRCCQSR